jgi:hypothetical protein
MKEGFLGFRGRAPHLVFERDVNGRRGAGYGSITTCVIERDPNALRSSVYA